MQLIPEKKLEINAMNHSKLTSPPKVEFSCKDEGWAVTAETLEKKVAKEVDMVLTYRVVSLLNWSIRKAGNAGMGKDN